VGVFTTRLEDTEDLVASNNLHLRDTMAISQDNTDLGRGGTLAGQLADVVDDLVGRALEPSGHAARVRDGGGGNTLALAVEATHVRRFVWVVVWSKREGVDVWR